MIQQLGQFPGEWCDVDWSPADGCFVFARLERPGVVAAHRIINGDVITAQSIAKRVDLGRWGLYLRCAADGAGNVCCVLQDGRDRNPATGQFYPAIVVLFPKDGPPFEIGCPAGPAFGQNAVEVVGFDSPGWLVYVATSPTTYWEATLSPTGVWASASVIAWPQTSQGFADGDDRMDDARSRVPGMVCPSTANGLSLGQNTSGPDRLVARQGDVLFTALPGVAFEPHLVSDGAGRWMGCARTPQGAALFTLAAPFEADVVPPEPPTPDPHDFDLVPTGTLVTGALRILLGDHPNQQGDIICLNKNTHPEAEWRKLETHGGMPYLLHWADASRFPGDRGWWIEPAPIWAVDTFLSGLTFYAIDHATLVDFHHGKTNRWRQTNTLYGTTGGGIMVQFDPRFPGQYTDMSKQGTPQWAPAGYEKQWTLPDGRSRWQYIVTPLTAKGRIPWGDPSMDIVIQEAENGPSTGPGTPQPFIPCPRPLVSAPKPPDPPKESEMTEAEAVARAAYPAPSDIVQGALAVFRENLLERDRIAPDLMTAGALRYFFQHFGPAMAAQQIRHGIPGTAEGWGHFSITAVQSAKDAYDREQRPGAKPSPVTGTLRGPIGVDGRSFVVPE